MMSENKSLIDVCYEQIKDNFYYGLFGDFKLVIDKSTGCFNATKLCHSGGKKFKYWSSLEKSKALLNYYKSRGRDLNFGFYEIKGDNNDPLNKQITGQYVPEALLQSIINWMTSIQTLLKEGFVYVITTSYLKPNNIFKIGYTKNFQERLDTFNAYRHSSEPQYFVVALYTTSDARTLETAIHRKLANYRDEGEFFKCDYQRSV